MAGRSGPVSRSASDPAPAAVLALLRPVNGAMAAAAVLVGAFVAGRPFVPGPALWGALSAFAAASGANAFNDYVDREADRINRPDRPIPSGGIAPLTALAVGLGAYGVSILAAMSIGLEARGLALSWVVVTILYSWVLSGVPLLGNVVVALVASSPLLMGAISQGNAGASLVPLGLAFLIHLAREVVKDAEDLEGDAAQGVRTFAVLFGRRASLALARFVVVLLMAAALLPYGFKIYGRWYLAVVVLVEAILAWRFVIRRPEPTGPEPTRSEFQILSRTLKVVMLLGLAAIALGRF